MWAWPTIVVIDKKGVIRYNHVGAGAYEKTESMIKLLLAELTGSLFLATIGREK